LPILTLALFFQTTPPDLLLVCPFSFLLFPFPKIGFVFQIAFLCKVPESVIARPAGPWQSPELSKEEHSFGLRLLRYARNDEFVIF